MPEPYRQKRIRQLLNRLELWEEEGLDLLIQLQELTEPNDTLDLECRRLIHQLRA